MTWALIAFGVGALAGGAAVWVCRYEIQRIVDLWREIR